MAHTKKSKQNVALDGLQRWWKMNLDHLGGGLAIGAFFMVISFVILAFLGLFEYDTSPGDLDTRGLSLPVYWSTFLGYVCWKIYEICVWRYHIHEREAAVTIHTLPKEVKAILLEILCLRAARILFVFGLLYSILLFTLWIMKI